MKTERDLFLSVIFESMDPCVGRSLLLCLHNPIFGTKQNQILEIGSCERASRLENEVLLTLKNLEDETSSPL